MLRAVRRRVRRRIDDHQEGRYRTRCRTFHIHRLLNDGIIAGEQLTPGAPWRIRLTDDLMARFNGEAGDGFMPMREAMRALGVSRPTVLQRVKRGELEAVHVMRGKQKGLASGWRAPPL